MYLKTLKLVLIGCCLCIGNTKAQFKIILDDSSSLVRVGMNPHPTDANDTILAYTLLSAIDHEDPDSIHFVCQKYKEKANNDLMKEKAWGALSYILERMLTAKNGSPNVKSDFLTEDLYKYFTENHCERLRHYLVLKYELNNYKPKSVKEHIAQRTYYDDLLMFNDPTREKWDMTEDVMKSIPLKTGEKVIDMGCGFGYNTLRLLRLVGKSGFVYATDTEEPYADYVETVFHSNGYENVKGIHTQSNELGVDSTVDCIFISSLYHILYTWSREDERKALLTSIKEKLRPGGHIVIVDNINRHGEELNNCHVDHRLIQAQLGYWGFKTKKYKQLNDQRYLLVLQRNDRYRPFNKVKAKTGELVLDVKSQKSVVHIGSLDSYDITDRGIDAANYVYDFMGGGDVSLAEVAIKKYDELIPTENFGGEYSALQWLCEAKKATPQELAEMTSDPLSESFYNYLTDDSCKIIRYYLLHKYKLGNDSIRMASDSLLEMSGEVGRTHRSYLEDYILALNPKRPEWEHTDKIISNLNLEKGMTIADIGCGSGFFSYRFSRLTGDEGKVYALELKDEHIERLKTFTKDYGINNIIISKGREDILELPCQVDKMFMCSLYHIMYGVISDKDRDTYIKSLLKWLKPDGELIIVDNGPVDDETLPYHGPYISHELIEKQLSFYGLELTEYIQIIPQRYMLKFKLKL